MNSFLIKPNNGLTSLLTNSKSLFRLIDLKQAHKSNIRKLTYKLSQKHVEVNKRADSSISSSLLTSRNKQLSPLLFTSSPFLSNSPQTVHIR